MYVLCLELSIKNNMILLFQVELLLLRAVQDTGKIYMLVHADSLTYEVGKQVEVALHRVTKECPGKFTLGFSFMLDLTKY